MIEVPPEIQRLICEGSDAIRDAGFAIPPTIAARIMAESIAKVLKFDLDSKFVAAVAELFLPYVVGGLAMRLN